MENRSDDSMLLDSRDKFTVVVEGGLILIINFVAFMGNLLICLIMYNKPRFHTTTNTFMLVLAVCYGFIASLVMPFTVGSLVTGRWLFGQVLCDIQGFSFLALTWVSLFTLTVMAISRFLQVTQMAFYNKCFSLNRSYTMIMAIWVLAIVVLICPVATGTAKFRFSPERSLCAISFRGGDQTHEMTYAVVTLTLYVTLPVMSLISLCALRRRNATVHASAHIQRRSESDMRIRAEELRTSRVLLAVILGVMIFWFPAVITKVLAFPMNLPRQVHLASTFLWFAVPALHPIIYGALHRPFSREVLRVPVLPMTRKRQDKLPEEHAI